MKKVKQLLNWQYLSLSIISVVLWLWMLSNSLALHWRSGGILPYDLLRWIVLIVLPCGVYLLTLDTLNPPKAKRKEDKIK